MEIDDFGQNDLKSFKIREVEKMEDKASVDLLFKLLLDPWILVVVVETNTNPPPKATTQYWTIGNMEFTKMGQNI